jgi:hypothetical protein
MRAKNLTTSSSYFEVTGAGIVRVIRGFITEKPPKRVDVYTDSGSHNQEHFPEVEIIVSTIVVNNHGVSFKGRPWTGRTPHPEVLFFWRGDGSKFPRSSECAVKRIQKLKW